MESAVHRPIRICNLCKSSESKSLFEVEGVAVLQCKACSHQFADLLESESHVQTVYDDDYFFGGGAGYDNYLRDSALLVERGERYANLVSKHLKPGAMVEIGAAAGFGLKAFADLGWDVTGIDPNPSMVQFAREQLGMNLHVDSLETWVPNKPVNLVVLVQVLPHLFQPREAIAKIASWLAPGGCLLVETWRRDSLTTRMTGRGWHEYNPPSVLHWFTLQELKSLGDTAGLKMVSYGRPKKYISGLHLKSILHHQATRFPLSRILKSCISMIPTKLNFRYPAEDLVWAMYQKPFTTSTSED
ncbi:MAG: class I SAM-dependent methyltransferase [Planctomycetota bacterium]|nr:class I SAM-dependent methyltransferase [Planctomycetota bacterium]